MATNSLVLRLHAEEASLPGFLCSIPLYLGCTRDCTTLPGQLENWYQYPACSISYFPSVALRRYMDVEGIQP